MVCAGDVPRWPFPQDGWRPPAEYDRIRAIGSPTTVRLYDGAPAWLLTGFQDVRTALRSGVLSSDVTRAGFPMPSESARAAKGLQRSFVRMDPPRHREQRRLVEPFFRRERILQLVPEIEQIVTEAVTDLAASRPPTDVVPSYARRIPAEVACLLLGLPRQDARRLHQLIIAWSTYSGPSHSVETAGGQILSYLDEALQAAPPSGSILAALSAADTVSRADRCHIAFLVLVSGFHTTANMIALSLLILLRDQAVRTEFERRADAVVDELLRYLSIARLTALRVATDHLVVGGVTIRPGEAVIASIEAANNDPTVFDQPQLIDLARSGPAHLSFGHGIHRCLGQDLARIELRLALRAFLEQLPSAELAVDERDLHYVDGATRGLAALPVSW